MPTGLRAQSSQVGASAKARAEKITPVLGQPAFERGVGDAVDEPHGVFVDDLDALEAGIGGHDDLGRLRRRHLAGGAGRRVGPHAARVDRAAGPHPLRPEAEGHVLGGHDVAVVEAHVLASSSSSVRPSMRLKLSARPGCSDRSPVQAWSVSVSAKV